MDPPSLGVTFRQDLPSPPGFGDTLLGSPDLRVTLRPPQKLGQRPVADRGLVLVQQPIEDLAGCHKGRKDAYRLRVCVRGAVRGYPCPARVEGRRSTTPVKRVRLARPAATLTSTWPPPLPFSPQRPGAARGAAGPPGP